MEAYQSEVAKETQDVWLESASVALKKTMEPHGIQVPPSQRFRERALYLAATEHSDKVP